MEFLREPVDNIDADESSERFVADKVRDYIENEISSAKEGPRTDLHNQDNKYGINDPKRRWEADMIITGVNPEIAIEAKRISPESDIRKALGQALSYQLCGYLPIVAVTDSSGRTTINRERHLLYEYLPIAFEHQRKDNQLYRIGNSPITSLVWPDET